MASKIDWYINKLDQIAEWWIKEDHFHHEFKDIIDTLDSIKKENKKWEPSKEQLNKIIKFLNEQTKTIPNGNFTMLNKLNWYKENFQNLLNQREQESNKIKKESKKDTDEILDELIAKWTITEETNKNKGEINKKNLSPKPQNNFSNSWKEAFEANLDLNNLTSYTVKSGDRLWDIVKAHYPKFTKTNKDIIHIINYIVNLNLKLNPKKLKHLGRDGKLAWWVKWADWIAGDNIRIGDVLKLPKIKSNETVIVTPKKENKPKKPVDIPPKKNPPVDIPPVDNKTEKITNKYTKHYIFENGRVLLVWKDWEKSESSKELSKEEIEIIKKFEKVAILNEVLEVWKKEGNNVVDSLHWKSIRSDGDKISEEISWVENDFAILTSLIQNNKASNEEINKYINTIFNKISIAEDQESIIGSDDMKEVKKELLSNDDKDQKLIKIFNLMRYEGLSWNSSTIKEKVANHLLAKDEFKDISKILKNKNLLPYIENDNTEKLTKLFWNKDSAKDILEAYQKIKVKQEQHRNDYKKILVKINKEKVANWEKEINLNDFIKLNVDYSIQTLVKHTLIESKVDSMSFRWKESDSYTWLYANLSWLAEHSNYDAFVIADNNIDTAIDIWTTLAISAVSMWVWALAAKLVMLWVEWAANTEKVAAIWTKLATTENRIWKWLYAFWNSWVTKWAWTSVIEWSFFQLWTSSMNNLIYWNLDWYKDYWKETLKSIAFMWVLRWTSNFMKWIRDASYKKSVAGTLSLTKTEKLLAWVWDLRSQVPEILLQNKTIIWILSEAWLLTRTSVWLEVAFEWEGEFTREEYFQALVMVALFKGTWKINKWHIDKIKFWKNKEWKIEADVTSSESKNTVKNEKEANNSENWTKKQKEVKSEEISEKQNIEKSENFNKLIEFKILSLENWKSIKIWENTITKNWDIYKVESNWKTETYLDTKTLIKDIKLSRKDKIEFISKNSTKDFIKNINKELISNKIEFKKEWDSYSIFKKWKKIEFEKLSNSEQNLILKKIFPNAKIENISNFLKNDFISKYSEKISNSLTWKSKKIFDDWIKKIKEWGSEWFDFMKNLIYKGFNGKPYLTTWKLWWVISLAWMGFNSRENIKDIYTSIIDDKKDIFTLENWSNLVEIVMQLYMFKTLWAIRAETYNFLINKLMEKVDSTQNTP